jgi:ribonuclease P protein component
LTRAVDGFCFSRANRLEGRHAFASVFAYKCSVAGEFFQVYAKPRIGTASRLGVSISKRYVQLAVSRNFCKRLAREVFRLHRLELCGIDLVVRARCAVPQASSAQARGEILTLMRRAWQLTRNAPAAAPNR